MAPAQRNSAPRGRSRSAAAPVATPAPATEVAAPRGRTTGKPPKKYRVRVRMYRQGLGDCFLLSFPRPERTPFHMLIDCGALSRDKAFMTGVVQGIRDAVLEGATGPKKKARLDVVVGTHEHKDHLSGFNQARPVFNDEFDIGSVWLAWTENLTAPEIAAIKNARRAAAATLTEVTSGPLAAAGGLANVARLLDFTADDDTVGQSRVADAMEYLKQRGRDAGDLRFLEPGGSPMPLGDVEGVRVYVLGPPRDASSLKGSEVTESMKRDDTVFNLTAAGMTGMDALLAAARQDPAATSADRYQPFGPEHRITRQLPGDARGGPRPNPQFAQIMGNIATRYDDLRDQWRRIDEAWLGAFDQLALDLDNDTNNTSLVLAFEFVKTGEVLLFVADAQIGSWLSWAKVAFDVPGRSTPLPAHDLLRRTVFYKVGHHCSHNATLKKGGLELMTSKNLVAFIPVDQETARKQGTQGWEMPAPALFNALGSQAKARVLSDVTETPPASAAKAGVVAAKTYIDYYLV